MADANSLNGSQFESAQHARAICEQFGAQPGTRMFYNCMKEQTAAAEYNLAVSRCASDEYSRKAKAECLQGGSGFSGLRSCLQAKERTCEQNAKMTYIPDADAVKIDTSNHQYIHTYQHEYPNNQ